MSKVRRLVIIVFLFVLICVQLVTELSKKKYISEVDVVIHDVDSLVYYDLRKFGGLAGVRFPAKSVAVFSSVSISRHFVRSRKTIPRKDIIVEAKYIRTGFIQLRLESDEKITMDHVNAVIEGYEKSYIKQQSKTLKVFIDKKKDEIDKKLAFLNQMKWSFKSDVLTEKVELEKYALMTMLDLIKVGKRDDFDLVLTTSFIRKELNTEKKPFLLFVLLQGICLVLVFLLREKLDKLFVNFE